MRPDVLVVIPTFNEAGNLARIVGLVRELGYRVLVVDDASPDGTGQVADDLAAADAEVHVLHRDKRKGLGPAYAAGFAWGIDRGASVLCEMDADFSHDPTALPDLVAAIDRGAGLAIGSRYVAGGGVEGWAWHRRLLSRVGNWYARRSLATDIRDMTAGFRAFDSSCLRRLDPGSAEASGYGFQVEMAWRAAERGIDVVEVPITFRERQWGQSKMSIFIALEAIWLVTVWGIRRRRRLRLAADHAHLE